MPRIKLVEIVNSSAEKLFHFSEDYKKRLEWDPFMKKMEFLDGATKINIGVKTKTTAYNGLSMETIFIAYKRPQVIAMKMTKGPFIFKTMAASWRFNELSPNQTEVIFNYNFSTRPKLINFFSDKIAQLILTRDMKKRIKSLKAAVEKGEPIFRPVFGKSWDELPTILKKHYANRPYSNDIITLDGFMDIKLSKLTRLMKPLFKLFGTLVPYEGENIPTTVYSKSEGNSNNYILERHFNFPDKKTYVFRSSMVHMKGSDIIEIMKFGIGWHCEYAYEDGKVLLKHKGYVWRIFGLLVPLPVSLLLGKGYAEEEAIDDNNFRMLMTMTHPWFGKTFEYKGQFKLV